MTCGRADGFRVPAGLLASCALLALLALTGCGGAGGDRAAAPGAGPSTSVLLFQDGFEDEDASSQRWTPSQEAVRIDAISGTLILTQHVVTTNAPPFERAGGELELIVDMAWPAWCPAGGAHTSHPIELVELDSGMVVASLVVKTAVDCTTVVEYRIDPTGTITPSSVVNPVVGLPFALADGFHTYRIVLLDDGRATWYRDGIAMITSFVPLSDRGYALRLRGAGVADAPAVLFDQVRVVRH